MPHALNELHKAFGLPLLPTVSPDVPVDLTGYSEIDLITALYKKDIDIEYIQAAYYALTENWYHADDEIHGYSEQGLHGRNATR